MHMTEAKAESPDKPFLPRWAVYVALPGFAGPLLILGFIFVSELRHSEERCPYRQVSQQAVTADVVVVEEARSCVADLQERRYSVSRKGQLRVLGRRRFADAAFGAGYAWKPALSPEGEVRVTVKNPGHDDAVFREGTPSERGEVAPR
jgi:hypothetical protein